ncbi:uncharacterized protein LOC144558254 [Carex rostrata]
MAAVESSEAKPNVACESHQKNLSFPDQEDDGVSLTAKFQVMPDLIGENNDSSEDEDKKERQEKFKRHEAEYVQHLKAKYFSNKTFTGDHVFEEETKIEDETIRSSRWPCTSAFANPAKYVEEKKKLEESSTVPASSGAETSTSTTTTPTKKLPSKKTP